jgi:hypothetical protein
MLYNILLLLILFVLTGTQGLNNFHEAVAEVSVAFKFFIERGLPALCSNPQRGGPGLHIYVPWRLGGPVILPGTGYPIKSPFTTCMGYSGTILFPGHHTGSCKTYANEKLRQKPTKPITGVSHFVEITKSTIIIFTSFNAHIFLFNADVIFTYYGPDDRGSRVRFPAGAGNFFLHHRIQTGSGAHPPSYPMGTRDSFPVGKAVGM